MHPILSMESDSIYRLLDELQAKDPSDTRTNPYRDENLSLNLRAYLETIREWPYSGHLLVGEAPGYRGGALTGIPFTSPRVLRAQAHPFLETLGDKISVRGNTAEATATMVWEVLQSCGEIPAFWNVFPFHPHRPGVLESNRRPIPSEVESGRPYLDRIVRILQPHTLVAVGRTALSAIRRWYPDAEVVAIRHPSHGGKSGFAAGLMALGFR